MKNKKYFKEKYLKSKKYQTNSEDIGNKYSLRNKFGFYFEYRKFAEAIKLFNYAGLNFKDMSILDIGCHRGFQLNYLAFLKGNSKELYGIDFIPSFIKQAKQINPKIDFKVMDFYNLKFNHKKFDFVNLIYIMNCMPTKDRSKIIGDILGKVNGGGYILVFEFSDNVVINLIRKLIKILKRENSQYTEYASDKILRKYFKGFGIIRSRRMINFLSPKLCGFLPYPLIELFDYIVPNNYYIALLRKEK